MSQKKARAARQAAAAAAAHETRRPSWTSWKVGLIVVAVAAVLGGSFVIPKLTQGSSTTYTPQGHSMGGMSSGRGDGPAIGSAPTFSERNVLTGQPISSRTLRGHDTLLFFSEGVMCQACLQQIHDIDQLGKGLAARHIKLVSITPDSAAELRQAIDQYRITSPMISDESRTMSTRFNTLGKGMHPDTPGHMFVLLSARGRVLWERDYYQPPYRTMYVPPAKLLKDIPAA